MSKKKRDESIPTTTVLTPEEAERFKAMIESKPEPNEAMRELFRDPPPDIIES